MTAEAPQQPLTFTDVFEDEEVEEIKEANTVHHIRANSSIMHVKKILGEYLARAPGPSMASQTGPMAPFALTQRTLADSALFALLQSPTVVKFVSHS